LHREGHVVLFRLRAELDLLGLHRRRALTRLLLLLRLLVLVLAVIHDPADGRERARRDLDEVEPLLLGEAKRFVRRHDAELLFVEDHPDLRDANAMVDAKTRLGAAAVETSRRSTVHEQVSVTTTIMCM